MQYRRGAEQPSFETQRAVVDHFRARFEGFVNDELDRSCTACTERQHGATFLVCTALTNHTGVDRQMYHVPDLEKTNSVSTGQQHTGANLPWLGADHGAARAVFGDPLPRLWRSFKNVKTKNGRFSPKYTIW